MRYVLSLDVYLLYITAVMESMPCALDCSIFNGDAAVERADIA
jgi:hypothetical protein